MEGRRARATVLGWGVGVERRNELTALVSSLCLGEQQSIHHLNPFILLLLLPDLCPSFCLLTPVSIFTYLYCCLFLTFPKTLKFINSYLSEPISEI